MNDADLTERVVIIGSGPAAWTAATYAGRANLAPLVYEGALTEENRLGATLPLGQLNWATWVENFPGFPEGVLGPELVVRMREQAGRYGTRIITEDVDSVDLGSRPFALQDSAGGRIAAHALIFAAGAVPRRLGLDSINRFTNRGVSMCHVSDGPLPRFRAKPLVVVGGGDSAADSALYLTKFASLVYLIHRHGRLQATPVLANQVLAHPKIVVLWDTTVGEVIGDEEHGMTAVRVRDIHTGIERTVAASGFFEHLGYEPNARLVAGQLETDTFGYVVLRRPPTTATSVPGVFAAGEVADPVYRQAVTAAAMGCQAALDAERWLRARGVV